MSAIWDWSPEASLPPSNNNNSASCDPSPKNSASNSSPTPQLQQVSQEILTLDTTCDLDSVKICTLTPFPWMVSPVLGS